MAVKSFNMWTFVTIVIIIAGVTLATPIPDPLTPDVDTTEGETEHRPRVRRQYYVCPPDFERISSYCYYFSQHQATWQDAHYDCRDRHSELAVVSTAAEDRKLRGQLNRSVKPLEWWIGGIYDWEQMKWKWVSGKRFEYHGFSRMGPENKEKLKWHCTIMDPSMKYKWSARSCVLGKHYICQKPVMKVNKKKLDRLRKKYNNTLNEIPAPIIDQNFKPRKSKKHENQANGNSKHNLKQYRPNGANVRDQNRLNNAFGKRNNTEIIRNARKERRNKNREDRKKNKRNKNKNILHIRNGNGLEVNGTNYTFPDDARRNRKRNRRNKSKENNSLENATFSQEELGMKKKKLWSNENTSIDDITQKTPYMTNTLNPLHPRVIVENFMDFNPNKNS